MSDAVESKPASYCFISYSRQEVTFVDSFSRELEKRGIHSWLDFRDLVPGQTWVPQLEDALQSADAILLVVSRASMSSRSVKDEWTKSLAAGRRVILILFEPCKLHPGLAGLEWVDFTQRFDRATDQLVIRLASPFQTATSPLPGKKIHLPGTAIACIVLSLLLLVFIPVQGILSSAWILTRALPGMETQSAPLEDFLGSTMLTAILFIWLPSIIYFLQLPVQIVRRTHNAQTLRNASYTVLALTLLLLILTLLSILVPSPIELDEIERSVLSFFLAPMITADLLTAIAAGLFIRLLNSDGMHRWSGPKGAFLRVAPPDLTGHMDNGIPMRVLVESAPHDWLYARELKDSITRAGHICTDEVQSADIVLPLLSTYKTNSAHDPETIRLIPILIQGCDVDERLSRLQWIDLRYGKVSVDAVANLLDEPRELLRLLGVLPVRTLILPGPINLLNNLLSILLLILMITFSVLLTGYVDGFVLESILDVVPFLVLIPVSYLLKRYLTHRRLSYLPFLSYWWAVGMATLLAVAVPFIPLFPGLLPLELICLPVPLLMLRKDVRMWLPPRTKGEILGKQPSMEQPAAPG